MSDAATKQQPTPKGLNVDIPSLVIQDIEARAKIGEERYGERLKPFNGRSAIIDAYQESIDLVKYLRQLIFEQEYNAKSKLQKGFELPCLDHGFVRYIDHMGTDADILEAARVSYKSESKGDEQDTKLLHYLYKNFHHSPFEMVKLKFNIKLPIFVMRQFVRHRVQNLNEVSGRYTELPAEFYIPNQWRTQDTKNKQGSVTQEGFDPMLCVDKGDGHMMEITASECLINSCALAYERYQEMINQGVAKEMARMILPVNIYTEIYCCWDLRNLMHFIRLREDSHAQWEIRQYADAMKNITKQLFPKTIEAFDRYKWTFVDKESND